MFSPKEIAQRLSGDLTVKTDQEGNKVWRLNGELHREYEPAIERADGDNYWLLNGKYHREDGPAIECVNGYKAWWVKGVFIRSQCCDPS